MEYFENEARWSLKLRIPPGTEPGAKTLRNQITFQICDASSCKPPARSTLPDVALTVVPGVGGGGEGGAAASTPGSPTSTTTEDAAAVTAADAEATPTSEVAREAQKGLLSLIFVSAGAGLLALVMPCVWPMIPITVNFFVKQGSKNKGKTTGLAIAYCLAIIEVFTSVGVLVSFFFSATALQNLANNPWLNAFVALVVPRVRAEPARSVRDPSPQLPAQRFGQRGRAWRDDWRHVHGAHPDDHLVHLHLPRRWWSDRDGGQRRVLLPDRRPGHASRRCCAFPFFLLALAPSLVSKMPKSGDWMNSVKVVGGLIEVGAAFKFINTAEIGFGAVPEDAWFDAPLVLSAWVVIAVVCGLYLLGLFRTDHDHDEVKIGPGRLLAGSLFLALALFLAPALFNNPPKKPALGPDRGHPSPDVGDLTRPGGWPRRRRGRKKAVSTDPATAEREEKSFHGVVWGMSYDEALEVAKASNKPVLIDFTGVNCVNCRKMEQTVLNRKEIVGLLSEFVTVQLYTDYVPIGSLTQEQREAARGEKSTASTRSGQGSNQPVLRRPHSRRPIDSRRLADYTSRRFQRVPQRGAGQDQGLRTKAQEGQGRPGRSGALNAGSDEACGGVGSGFAQSLADRQHLGGVVDRVERGLALENAEDIRNDRTGHVAQPLLGLSRAVRGEHDVGPTDQRDDPWGAAQLRKHRPRSPRAVWHREPRRRRLRR